ncbi:hypothetical protein HHK36_009829 [Tetracentron sinense]|uniref:PUM-HD domain-containing protein n=1 Tax=Tetracentron sinense TaxID=13715 RepID=A0A834ZBK0_TETSI|nr:hypothetical protein HHK36_009829 [Tetracentron sinense]
MERRNREEELKLLLGDIQIGTSADLPENHCHLLRQYLPSHNNPPETSIPQNGTLETAIARLNLSAFPHQSQFLPPPSPTVLDGAVGAPMPRQPRTDPLTGLGLSPLSVQRMQQRNLELQRLRIAAYLQSQGIPTMGAESLGSYGLARSNLNSTDVSDESYSKFLNGGRTETEINRSGKCCCCCCNHRNEQHQLSGPNGNGFRLDSGRQYRGRAINGLVSESENSIMKSLLRHHSNHLSLEDLRGKILSMAKDQHGCRFLQQKFKEGNAEDIEMIFSEVKDHMGELMLDQFGNYFVQKLLDVCNEEQRTEVLLSVTRNEWGFITICLDTHGYS